MAMRLNRYVVGGVALGTLALCCAAAAPAGASAAGARPLPPRSPWSAGARYASNTATDTTVFAGYEATSSVTSVSDRFVVPSISCASGTTGGIGPGAYLVGQGSTGSDFDGADVSMQCSGGSLLTGEYVVVDNVDTEYSDPVAPGDVIEASVSLNDTVTTVTIKDLTKADHFSLAGTAPGASAEAEFIGVDTLSSASGVLPVPTLHSIGFNHASIGEAPLGTASPAALALTNGCAVTLVPTAVGTGSSFKVKPPSVSVTDLNPASGPAGTVVTISGTGFTPTSAVRFDGVRAKNVTDTSSTELQATVPSKAASGPVSVVNTAPKGTGTSVCDFTVSSK
jgi:IPT/TIG domain